MLKLAEQLLCNSRNPERKREKIFTCQWRNRKEKEILEENGQQIKRQVEVIIRELKTGIQCFEKMLATMVGRRRTFCFEQAKTAATALKFFFFFSGIFSNIVRVFLFIKIIYATLFLFTMVFFQKNPEKQKRLSSKLKHADLE